VNDFFPKLLNMLRLRAGPQDLPSSWPLTIIVIAIYLGEGLLTSQQLDGDYNSARTLLSAIVQFAAVAVMLNFRKHPERLQQALLALAGTGVIIGLIAFVFLMQADPDQNQPILALGWFAIFFWSLAVDAHIFRHTFAIPMSQGVLIAVGLLAITYVIMHFLFVAP